MGREGKGREGKGREGKTAIMDASLILFSLCLKGRGFDYMTWKEGGFFLYLIYNSSI
jgi:hypothetical protein